MRLPLLVPALMAAIALAAPAGVGVAAEKPASQESQAKTTPFAVVTIQGKEVMRLTDAGGHAAQSRAHEVDKRLREVLESESGRPDKGPVKPSEVTVQKSGNLYVVRLRDANVITASSADAQLAGKTPQALAEQWATTLRDVLSGIHVTAKENLPKDFVTIATGQVTMPSGGGAGTGMQPKDKEKKQEKQQQKE